MTELATGEALISFLQEDGTPGIVQRAMVIAPACSMDKAPDEAKSYIIQNDMLHSKYDATIDRESAYEILNATAIAAAEAAEEARRLEEEARQRLEEEKEAEKLRLAEEKEAERIAREEERQRIAEEKEAERQRIAAEREAERQRIAAEKEAERQRIAAEREAERQRIAAEKQAEKERVEAERRAEREERERRKFIDAALTSASRAVGSGAARGILGLLKKL